MILLPSAVAKLAELVLVSDEFLGKLATSLDVGKLRLDLLDKLAVVR
jgi:hypothetical protein